MFISSHLVWVRGLKPALVSLAKDKEMSHLVWVRGLKPNTTVEGDEPSGRTSCGCVD